MDRPMECFGVREQSISFLTGEVDSRLWFEILDHIASCSSCAEEVNRFQEVWDFMENWDVPPIPSPTFKNNFWKKISAERERAHNKPRKTPWFQWGPSWVPVAMAATVLLVLSWFLFPVAKPVKQLWNVDDGLVNEVLMDPDAVEIILSSFEEAG